MSGFATRRLGVGTWPLFERLFTSGNGWDFCGCMFHHRGRHLSRSRFPTRAEMGVTNRAEHRALVETGETDGVLVVGGDEPVGWCQFGPAARFCRPAPAGDAADPDWRITCFVVDKGVRRTGVARAALHDALQVMAQQGGGVVEATAVVGGRPSGAHGGYLAMFEEAGFEVVGDPRAREVAVRLRL